jgi:hypothetical protein
MDFKNGNSGCDVRAAVIKRGPECLQEGAYCKLLGPKVTPVIYGLLDNGYVMEFLDHAVRGPTLIREMEALLSKHVWSRPSLDYDVTGQDWKDYHRSLGLEIPDWVIPSEFCMTHGDPTVSNTFNRGWDLLIGDPRPPRFYVPQCKESDMGRLVQSYMGWECVAYDEDQPNYQLPDFWFDRTTRNRALFWCAAATFRIEDKERKRSNSRDRIIKWCQDTRQKCSMIYGS